MGEIVFGTIMFFVGFWAGSVLTFSPVMEEAYERGYAVECLGKTGYHWECDSKGDDL